MNGGSGNDVITGGLGNETIDGGAGNDTVTGGEGTDIFMVGVNGATILDVAVGTDTLDIGGILDLSLPALILDVLELIGSAVDLGGSVSLDVGDGDLILPGLDLGDLTLGLLVF